MLSCANANPYPKPRPAQFLARMCGVPSVVRRITARSCCPWLAALAVGWAAACVGVVGGGGDSPLGAVGGAGPRGKNRGSVVLRWAFEPDQQAARGVLVHDREGLVPARVDGADLDVAGDPGADLDAMVGRAVRVLQDLNAPDRGQRRLEAAVRRFSLFHPGELQHEFVAQPPKFSHSC